MIYKKFLQYTTRAGKCHWKKLWGFGVTAQYQHETLFVKAFR